MHLCASITFEGNRKRIASRANEIDLQLKRAMIFDKMRRMQRKIKVASERVRNEERDREGELDG